MISPLNKRAVAVATLARKDVLGHLLGAPGISLLLCLPLVCTASECEAPSPAGLAGAVVPAILVIRLTQFGCLYQVQIISLRVNCMGYFRESRHPVIRLTTRGSGSSPTSNQHESVKQAYKFHLKTEIF